MEANGYTGTVRFADGFVTIVRKGGVARFTVGKGEKRIPVVSISAVQWKPAGAMFNGYIEFTIAGGNEGRSRAGSATSDAVSNENAVVFMKKQMPEFELLRAAIEQAIIAPPAPSLAAAPDLGAQIAQLAGLRDQGILTDAEFDAKKAELLSRM